MWICGQDQRTREAVAHYFNEPYQFFQDPIGASRRPDRSGSLFESRSSGQVPESEKVAMGRGRESHTPGAPSSPSTKTANDWLHRNEKAGKYWRGKAVQALKRAALLVDEGSTPSQIEGKAGEILAEQMKQELRGNGPRKKGEDLHEDLLGEALADVNWDELAEDLLRQERIPQ
jgi:hypothetical protein